MKLQDIAPGDVLRFRQWEDMEREFGLNRYGSINCQYVFITDMKPLCGKEVVVSGISGEFIHLEDHGDEVNGSSFNISADMLEPIAEDIQDVDFISGLMSILKGQ